MVNFGTPLIPAIVSGIVAVLAVNLVPSAYQSIVSFGIGPAIAVIVYTTSILAQLLRSFLNIDIPGF